MKILMRATINPLENMNKAKYVIENHVGGNIGNMIFTYSILKTIMVDDRVSVDFVNIKRTTVDDAYIDYVNSNYDMFIIPLANAFKNNFVVEMKKLTKLIKGLKIPCHIPCVGLQTYLTNKNFAASYQYNDVVIDFLKAVLEKTEIIGVRGGETAKYLSDIGFKQEKDFTVVGCPSMFVYGKDLPKLKDITLNEHSVVSFNSKTEFEEQKGYKPYVDFCKRNMPLFENHIYAAQQINDIRMAYLPKYDETIERAKNKFYDTDRIVSFTSIKSMFDYFEKNVDFSIGTRIHGNIGATLAGVPSIIVPYDKRVWELADYHNLPMVGMNDLTDDTTLYDLFEKADFNSIYKGHEDRFNHYVDFWNKLNIDTIYNHQYSDDVPFDKILNSTEYDGIILPYSAMSDSEKIKELEDMVAVYRNRANQMESKMNTLKQDSKAKISALQAENKKVKNELKKERSMSIFARIKRAVKRRLKRLLTK